MNGARSPRVRHTALVVLLLTLTGAIGGASRASSSVSATLFADNFNKANGANSLVTNEYANLNPTDPRAVRSSKWVATSGSFFVKRGTGWTGVPDGCHVDRYSQHCNDSAVFRLHTRRYDFGNVTVSLRLLNHGLTTTTRTPARAIDGVHIWLRYQSETELYAVSVNRRDSTVVIKKKCAGGPSNGGSYYSLATVKNEPIPFGVWQRIAVTIRNNPDGSVGISLSRNGVALASATDNGTGCAPILAPGAIGIRGDNDDFSVDNLSVTKAQGT